MVLVTILVVAVLASLPAQDISTAAGIKGGMNLGWFSGDDWSDGVDTLDGDNGVGLGLTIGGFLELGFTEQFAAQPEFLFFQQKGKVSYEVGGDDATTVTRINTIQIPILAKGIFPVDGITLFGVLGPSVFITLGDAKVTTEVDGSKDSVDETPDNRMLLGLAVGAGFEYPIDPGALIGELRYTRVLSRYENNQDVFGNSVSLLVGYGFAIE
jgi:hypothetical protein